MTDTGYNPGAAEDRSHLEPTEDTGPPTAETPVVPPADVPAVDYNPGAAEAPEPVVPEPVVPDQILPPPSEPAPEGTVPQ